MKVAAPLLLGAIALGAILFGLRSGLGGSLTPLPEPARAESVAPAAVRIEDRETIEDSETDDLEPIAVVELFTSEGCSSCPPADRLLREFAGREDDRLFLLAFHVDYWNRLGWQDPFSEAAYSQRQRAYARATESSRVYTPQMIVNGRSAFVGSRRWEAERAIRQALDTPALATVDLTADAEGSTVTVRYTVDDAAPSSVLHLALVQRRAEQAVPRGENAGRTLQHANVVRAFETMPVGASTQTFSLPDGLTADDVAIVAYVQDPDTMEISGAAQMRVVSD